ncbi:hypothetical protein NKI59_29990 [Mesorhizobium sp. M0598]|uniref:hypothetical protein n=1 Tax=Mesorhizobium sp. M0598 TaxID=2956968 RepID=UPI00333DEDAF
MKKPPPPCRSEKEIKGPAEKVVGKATFSSGDIQLSIVTGYAPAFGDSVEEELQMLIDRFSARQGEGIISALEGGSAENHRIAQQT